MCGGSPLHGEPLGAMEACWPVSWCVMATCCLGVYMGRLRGGVVCSSCVVCWGCQATVKIINKYTHMCMYVEIFLGV